jgi:hypothetical protein
MPVDQDARAPKRALEAIGIEGDAGHLLAEPIERLVQLLAIAGRDLTFYVAPFSEQDAIGLVQKVVRLFVAAA